MGLRRFLRRFRRARGPVKVICALGNPGAQYARTRHNAGWWFADQLQAAWELPDFVPGVVMDQTHGARGGQTVVLIKPQTYMNRSGAALASLRRRFEFDPASDLLVVVDDISLPPGRVRFRPRGSAGGHNGLKSIEKVIGGREYGRLKIGVGGRPSGADLAEWVLSEPRAEEEDEIRAAFPRLVDAVDLWLTASDEDVMNRINA